MFTTTRSIRDGNHRITLVTSIVAITLTAVFALTGCSSNSGDTNPTGPVETSFITAADKACGTSLDQAQSLVFPYSDFVATNPDISQLPTAGKYYDAVEVNHDGASILAKLGQPGHGTASWSSFVTLVGQEQALAGQQIKTAEASDKTGFVATVNQIAALEQKIDSAATAVGFAADSNCAALFG